MEAKDKNLKRRGVLIEVNRDICSWNMLEPGLAVDIQSQRLWMIQLQSLSDTRRPCREWTI